MHVAAGFMPVFKYRQKNSLIVLEHGHKARGYVSAPEVSKIPSGLPANDVVRFRDGDVLIWTGLVCDRRRSAVIDRRYSPSTKLRISSS